MTHHESRPNGRLADGVIIVAAKVFGNYAVPEFDHFSGIDRIVDCCCRRRGCHKDVCRIAAAPRSWLNRAMTPTPMTPTPRPRCSGRSLSRWTPGFATPCGQPAAVLCRLQQFVAAFERSLGCGDIDTPAHSATIRSWASISAKWKTGASKRLRTKRLRSA